MAVGEDGTEPVQADKRKKKEERSKKGERRSIFIFSSKPAPGGVGIEKPAEK